MDEANNVVAVTEQQIRGIMRQQVAQFAGKAWPNPTSPPGQLKEVMEASLRSDQKGKVAYDKIESLMPGAWNEEIASAQAQLLQQFANSESMREQKRQYDSMRAASEAAARKAQEEKRAFSAEVKALKDNPADFESRATAAIDQLKEQALKAGQMAMDPINHFLRMY